jgi:hypothetical protein
MKPLSTDLPRPEEFDDSVSVARDLLRLSLAYFVAHHKLSLADVVVRAATAFTDATEAEASESALESLFDAVKHFREAMESLESAESCEQ